MPQNENMFADDISFPDLFEGFVSHFTKRPRTQDGFESTTSCGKGRSKGRYNSSDSSSKSGTDPLVQLLAKLCLRQEDIMLNHMNLDRNLIFFLQDGKGSILPTILLASEEWHQQKQ